MAALRGDPESLKTIEEEAQVVFDVSARFKDAFKDEESITEALHRVASQRGNPQVEPEELRVVVAVAAAEGTNVAWIHDPSAEQPRASKGKGKNKLKAGPAHEQLSRIVFPIEGEDVAQSWDENAVRRTVEILVRMWATFEQT